MNISFNLVDQPWIQCIDRDNKIIELSLGDTLKQSHDLVALWDESPLVEASLYRLLLAVIHRAYDGPPDVKTWHAMYKAGNLDANINEYLAEWHHRFDLFDEAHPFYQTPYSPVRTRAVNKLIPHFAAGGNPTLADHHTDDRPETLTAAEAARHLVAAQAFSIGGGQSGLGKGRNFRDSPCTRGIIFIIEGQTLFETMLLNLLPYTVRADDAPSWESGDPFARDDLHDPAEPHVPRGYLDYLTWQPRRITLYPQLAGYTIIVREMKFTQGLQLSVPDILDPMKSYRSVGDEDEPRFIPATFRRQGAWYNRLDLIQHRNAAVLRRMDDGDLPVSPPRHYLAMGMETAKGQARVDAYHRERLPFLFDSDFAAETASAALDTVQAVRRQLWGAMYRLAETYIAPLADQESMKPDKNDVQAKMSHWGWESDFWSRVEDASVLDWAELERIAWGTLESAANKLFDPTREKAAALARRQLGAGLRKTIQEGEKEE